jgi:hypothetical protein
MKVVLRDQRYQLQLISFVLNPSPAWSNVHRNIVGALVGFGVSSRPTVLGDWWQQRSTLAAFMEGIVQLPTIGTSTIAVCARMDSYD